METKTKTESRTQRNALIRVRRGLQANVPSSSLNAGEFLLAKDSGNLYICLSETRKRLLATEVHLGDYLKKHENLHDIPDKNEARRNLSVYSKREVDALLTGLTWKEPARAISMNNITLSGTQSLDGVTLAINDRVLVRAQTDPKQNGIYIVNKGTEPWERALDADSASELKNAAIFVSEGDQYGDTAWVMAEDNVSVGSTPIKFVQFAGKSTYAAGIGLSLDGNTFNLDFSDLPIANEFSHKDRIIIEDVDDDYKPKKIPFHQAMDEAGYVSDTYKVRVDASDAEEIPGGLSEKIEGSENMSNIAKGIAVSHSGGKTAIGLAIAWLPEYTNIAGSSAADIKSIPVCEMNNNQKASINQLLKYATVDGGTF